MTVVDTDAILSHSRFFDHLVDLIPAKYYRADEHEHVELRFLPQQAKAAAKQDFKKQAKANKRKKLDPSGGKHNSSEDEEAQPGPGSARTAATANLGGNNCSREELQARKGAPTSEQEKQKSKKKVDSQAQPEEQPSSSGRTHTDKQQQGSEADFEFARLEFEDKKPQHGKKKLTKQQLLEAAEAKAQEAAAAEGNEEAKAKQAADAWRNAMARAGGDKVLDDPKLLRRSLKKEVKRKDKHAKAWQERKASQEEQKEKAQNRRQANLQARSKAKIDKKKAKSDKKLLRAGFEGRKSGFIGGNKK
ncbi:surfeit locus protein 6-domain-containing protein [Dunaliella salina]|uniref:Surfeit locus protein 6-domain-containing protein n=1 Tax=Dunaliella salina TaxID=3046 RepID=A0ABQ7H838_DUNSA|nr:surfeit locus protein 6-domain-containing protein [Dunaliella salina]|eukprot:KAF5843024.1 surfeit locus protein 6-domain-containing protein [Dunaliella salina]